MDLHDLTDFSIHFQERERDLSVEFLKDHREISQRRRSISFFRTSQKVSWISKDRGSWFDVKRPSRMGIYTVADAGFEFNFLRVRVLR